MIRAKVYATCLLTSWVLLAGAAHGESGYRKTLLQWSYGTSFEGGADVYEPLVTDRPDFTEASSTVGYGVAQLETGYTYLYDKDGLTESHAHSFPESLLRLGMFADWFELRVDWNYGAARSEFGVLSQSVDGADDLGIGVKLALTPQEAILPETAIILQTSLPTGSSGFGADGMQPGFNYLYGWDINERWSTGGSTGVNRAEDAATSDAYVLLTQSWTVGRSWTEQFGSFAEWFVLAPTSSDTDETEHYVNGGGTYLISDDIQWDVRVGLGLSAAADDFFAGTGLSLRYW